MTLDRAELTGASAALVFHIALIAALSMSLASVAGSPTTRPLRASTSAPGVV